MLTGFSYYNIEGFPNVELQTDGSLPPALFEENEALPLTVSLLARTMSDPDCGAALLPPEGMTFADLLRPGAGFISLNHSFRLLNPKPAGRRVFVQSEPWPGRELEESGIRPDGEPEEICFRTCEAGPQKPGRQGAEPGVNFSGRRPGREEGDDFKYLCRLFGRRFSEVEAFEVKNTMTFVPGTGAGGGNMLSYQLAEVVMEMRYEGPVTAFYELVRNRGGNNFVLYYESLPDIFGEPKSGEARGCTVLWEALAVRGILSDDARAAAGLPLITPTIERLSALLRRLYRRNNGDVR